MTCDRDTAGPAGRAATGARLRAERLRRRWSRPVMAAQIAAHLADHQCPKNYVLVTYIKRWEAGTTGMSFRYQLACAGALGIPHTDLFGPPQDLAGPAPQHAGPAAPQPGPAAGTSVALTICLPGATLHVCGEHTSGALPGAAGHALSPGPCEVRLTMPATVTITHNGPHPPGCLTQDMPSQEPATTPPS